MSSHRPSPGRRRLASGLLAAAVLAPAGAAQAATTPCSGEPLQQVFAAWGDSSWYFAAAGGGFEEGAPAWSLSGGAAAAAGTDPFGLGGAGDERSLVLPAGSSATSAPFCIRRDSRTVRWVQRGRKGSRLAVRVLHVDERATTPGRTLRAVRGEGAWEPSPPVTIPMAGTGLRGNGRANVALEFTALAGNSRIDDLYVDPKMRR